MEPFKLCTPNSVTSSLYAGDTWSGFTVDGYTDPPADPEERLPGIKSARMQFRDTKGNLVWELNTETGSEYGLPTGYPNNTTGSISIVEDAHWVLSVDSQPLPLGSGMYIWDLEITDELNVVRSLLVGTLIVCGDITR